MNDWLAGYTDDDEAFEDEIVAPQPARPKEKPVKILRCRHCDSDKLRPRSSYDDKESVVFTCVECNRTTSHPCPNGYVKVYRAE